MKNEIIGVCGDNCTECPRYAATQKEDTLALSEVKNLWIRLGYRDPGFPIQDMRCNGCKPENLCAYPDIRECAVSKALENCGLCSQYPCGMIVDVFEKTEKLRSLATNVCMPQEIDMLDKAFFLKKKCLDQIHFIKAKNTTSP